MVRRFYLAGVLACSVFAAGTGHAAYNSNISGVITAVTTYTDVDDIYFTMSTQPSTHASCNPSYFVISSDVPLERRKQLLATLLAAKASGDSILVGYDGVGSCAYGYIRVHRPPSANATM